MKKLTLLFIISASCFPIARADDNPNNSIGIEPNYSYKGGLNEAINLFNGNVNVSVPLLNLKGRAGLDLNVTLSYDSRQFTFIVDEMGSGRIAWNYTGPTMGRWVGNFSPYVREWYDAWNYTWHAEVTLETGAKHQFDSPSNLYPRGVCSNSSDMEYHFDSKILSTKSGLWYDFSRLSYWGGPVRKGDANGNYQDFVYADLNKVTQIIDSLGRTVNIYYEHPTNANLPTRMTVLNNTGAVLTYTFEYAEKAIEPHRYGYLDGYPGYVSDFAWMLTRINLPDGKAWVFTYYDGYPDPSGARLKRIDYPMGGYSRYEYTLEAGTGTLLDYKLWKKVVNANNGQGELTTTYSYYYLTTTEVLNPDGSYEVHWINGNGFTWKVDKKTSPSGTILETDNTSWQYMGTYYPGYRVSSRGTSYVNTPWWSTTNYTYDDYENIIQEETLANSLYTDSQQVFRSRRATRSFQTISVTRPGQTYASNISRILEESVSDKNSSEIWTLVSKTKYAYDQFALTDRSGVAGHDTSFGTAFTTRGNPTTVSKWLATESRWIDAKNYYDILGNGVKMTDARNYSTTTNYSLSFQFAYPTQVTNPKNQIVSMNYNFNTGQLISATDANNKTTTATLDSLNRTTRIDAPDGSYTTISYDLTADNFSTTVYKSVASGQGKSATTYLDGIGREKRKKTSDPAGDIYQDTEYAVCDCKGRTSKVSNPYRLGETIYWTERQYDALGRVTKIIPPDGTSTANNLSYSYDVTKPITTITDAAAKSRKYEYDVLGRIWRVTEPDSSGLLTLATIYNYLPSGGQPGLVINQGVQSRTLVYDTVGRLKSETHPENGATSYVYDDNGNLTQKTDARGWITNHTYDELNRLNGKTYQSDGGVTPTVTMTYDTGTYGVGRLASWSAGTTSSGSRTYDSMGRLFQKRTRSTP